MATGHKSNIVIPKFTELNDLISEKCGGKIIFATDDWFAAAENLIKPDPPVWREGFTEFGKWMDGWETRRKRIPGHDWCIIKMGLPGTIRGVEVDTRFFTGNFAPRISVQAARIGVFEKEFNSLEIPNRDPSIGKAATEEEFAKIATFNSDEWETIVPMSNLGPGYEETSRSFFSVNLSTLSKKTRFTHIRLNLYPDGGVARFRVYGVAVPELSKVPSFSLETLRRDPSFETVDWKEEDILRIFGDDELVDLIAMENGGICLGYSDAHYGHPRNLIAAGRGINMGDGWETARRLDRPAVLATSGSDVLEIPGFEWCAFKLGIPGVVSIIEVDTNHFKGNYADSVTIQGAMAPDDWNEVLDDLAWETLLPIQKLGPHKRHFFRGRIVHNKKISHCRIIIKPDGGISRVRLYGKAMDNLSELVEEDSSDEREEARAFKIF